MMKLRLSPFLLAFLASTSQAQSDAKLPAEGQVQTQPGPDGQGGVKTTQDGTWTDPASGLMWPSKDNGSDVDQPQAEAFCSNLQVAGHKDWRLATIEQLQGIYDPGVDVTSVFGDGATYSVHVKGNLQITGRTWSSRPTENKGKGYDAAWYFEFAGPKADHVGVPLTNFVHYAWDSRALCVRRAGETK